MKTIYFFNEEWETEYIKELLPNEDFNFVQGSISENPTVSDSEATILSVFVNSPVKAAELDRFPSLKLIVTRSTGFDHIDTAECKKRGIAVANVPTYGDHTVAEFAMALLLSLSRHVCDAHQKMQTVGVYAPETVRGFDLREKTIGIVGTGHIGLHLAQMAKGFNMKILAFDVRKNEEEATKTGFQYVTFENLLSQSDVISLHAPYNQHTHHMINLGNYQTIKRGSYLINTARGGLVETAALVAALEEGVLAGAGLDVLEEEGDFMHEESFLTSPNPSKTKLMTLLSDHYLIRHPNVIVTEHIAFNTTEAIKRILGTTAGNISSYRSATPINIVSIQ